MVEPEQVRGLGNDRRSRHLRAAAGGTACGLGALVVLGSPALGHPARGVHRHPDRGGLALPGRPGGGCLAGALDRPVRRPAGGPRADPAEGGAGAAGGRFLYPGTGPRRGEMGGDRGGRPRIPGPRSSLRRRPRSVRPRLDVRAALHGADANRRGGARLVAARAGRARRRSPNATGRSTSCGRGWTCARTSSSWAPRSGRGSIRTPWRPGVPSRAPSADGRCRSPRRSWPCSGPPP